MEDVHEIISFCVGLEHGVKNQKSEVRDQPTARREGRALWREMRERREKQLLSGLGVLSRIPAPLTVYRAKRPEPVEGFTVHQIVCEILGQGIDRLGRVG